LKKLEFKNSSKKSKISLPGSIKKTTSFTALEWMATKLVIKNLKNLIESRKLKTYALGPTRYNPDYNKP
jgi:hypothetical protein